MADSQPTEAITVKASHTHGHMRARVWGPLSGWSAGRFNLTFINTKTLPFASLFPAA
jgi:hypothetical protein